MMLATSRGPVEYAVEGTGVPVLVLHGSPGGIDAAEAMARFLPRSDFRVILVSRPGYLGTPLGDIDSIDDEADLHAATLAALNIDSAAVLAWSGGGPPAFQLAARHPERVSALVAISPVAERYTEPPRGPAERLLFGTALGARVVSLLTRYAPEQIVQGAVASEGTLDREHIAAEVKQIMADDTKRRVVLDVTLTAVQSGRRKAGWRNDAKQWDTITTLDFGDITAPTLIVAGTHDSEIPYDGLERAAAAIPNAELLTLDQGTHLAFYTHAESAAAQERARSVLAGGST